MEDLGEEEQAKIKQLMFDDRQKKLGLPTSEEQVFHILRNYFSK